MKTELFDFELPRSRIAQRPARPRDAARLLVVGERLEDRIVRDLPDCLRPGDLLICNDTKVIPARLTGRRGAARIEVTLHKREHALRWRAFARPAKRLRPGDRIGFAADLAATVEARDGGAVTLSFDAGDGAPLDKEALAERLERHGAMPLPPYIDRGGGADPRDRADYQTVFARAAGAVAAPTAGLHFTPALLEALAARGIGRAMVTLHVGAGTFLPVKSEDARDHEMHSEWGELSAATAAAIAATRAAGGRVVAVGTTALRVLEAAAARDPGSARMARGQVAPFAGEIDLFILPGYRFKATDMLLTNFHLPRSTLFMLVSAFAGLPDMRAAYAHAKAAGYRFFSYGDACLLTRREAP